MLTTRMFMVVGNGFGHSKINLLHFGWLDDSARFCFILISCDECMAVQNRNVNEFRSMF